MNLHRLLPRAAYYFRQGFAQYLNYILGFINFVNIGFYLTIVNIPALQLVFPHFYVFAVFSLFSIIPLGVCVGWMHYKGYLRFLWKAQRNIEVEADPFETELMIPVNFPQAELLIQLGKKANLDTSGLEDLLKRSKEHFKK